MSAAHGLAAKQLALACAMIALGGLLLGLQVDGNGALVGTGYPALGVGAIVALAALLFSASQRPSMPRDLVTGMSAASAFVGLAFLVSGVLAPGGGWMFFEVLLLVVVFARTAARDDSLSRGAIALLALMLLFRLWISYQGSRHEWQLVSIDVPILSSIPLDFLAPIQQVELGAFTPRELGLPPAGLDFAPSLALWTAGFVLCVVGVAWRARAACEHENDRVHATIHELPPSLATLVERLLPEGEWRALGLHGLADRALRKRIEELVVARVVSRRELDRALASAELLAQAQPGGFASEIHRALTQGEP